MDIIPANNEKSENKSVKSTKRFRIIILNEETYDQKYSFRFGIIDLIKWIGLLAIFFITITIFIIAFSPLREYIPGYSGNPDIRRKLVKLADKVDSLERNSLAKDRLLDNIKGIIAGKPPIEKFGQRSEKKNPQENLNLKPGAEELDFRKEVEKKDQFDIDPNDGDARLNALGNYHFFSPMKGRITTAFNPEKHHYGIDIVAPKNEAVKATLDGTVIFAGWTSETGYTMQIQHSNNLVSIYKHNAVLLKKEGTRVRAGEAIAITGNSGELTTSPHLHFEIWVEGKPADPMDFMAF